MIRYYYLSSGFYAGDVARGPGALEIKAAGESVDIQNLPCKIEPGADSALHRLEVHLA